jgi:type II secretory pathway pseudopilin PulG
MVDKSLLVGNQNFCRNSRRRRATTLVELLAVVALVSILLTVVGTLAVHLRQWDRQVRDHRQHTSQLAVLAEKMRADVRRSTNITLPAKNTVAIDGPESREISYELEFGLCRRMVKTRGEQSPKIETFAIGPVDGWKLETAAPGRRPAYTISLERSDSDKATSRQAAFFVYAALGSDLP